jgi:hypothetical protein
MKRSISILSSIVVYFLATTPAFASTSSIVTDYTHTTVNIITIIASSLLTFFLVKGGYLYMTSSGNPENLLNAKRTIIRSIAGVLLVFGANIIVSTLTNAFSGTIQGGSDTSITFSPIVPSPGNGVVQILIDAITGVIQNFIQSGTKPVLDALIGMLTTTPSLLSNSVIWNFWIVMVGITDSLYVVVIALLGLHVMSSDSLGFEQVEIQTLLPRIGVAFLGSNVSLFLADYVSVTCNMLVKAVLNGTGGITHAWVLNATTWTALIDPKQAVFITLIFLLLFLILAIVLLLMLVGRLIFISLGAVLSPFMFLLWVLPKFSDIAEIGAKVYIANVFSIFVQVVVIQLACSFLALPEVTDNSLLALAIAIGLFFSLLKIPKMLYDMAFYSSGVRSFKQLGGQIMNILTTSKSTAREKSGITHAAGNGIKMARETVRV